MGTLRQNHLLKCLPIRTLLFRDYRNSKHKVYGIKCKLR